VVVLATTAKLAEEEELEGAADIQMRTAVVMVIVTLRRQLLVLAAHRMLYFEAQQTLRAVR
jgi:hypothetical protein